MGERAVLLVEDHPDTGEVIRILLEEIPGLRVVLARDGREALSRLRETKPVLVILDLVLPGMDGAEVARRLQSDPATADIPLIAITAMPKACAKALYAGCLECIEKPFDLDHLADKVRQYLDCRVCDTPAERPACERIPTPLPGFRSAPHVPIDLASL